MKNILLPVIIFLFVFHLCEGKRKCRLNPCSNGNPLEDSHGKRIICRKWVKPCPSGYECRARLCCPEPTTTSTTTMSTTLKCPELPDCSGGIIEYDELGCPLCLIIDTCPGFPCYDSQFCYPTNTTFPNNIILGMCYVNPCASGSPLEDDTGFLIPCDINENNPTCPNSYVCTPLEIHRAVCCPIPTTTTSSTTSPCPEFFDCSDGITQYDEFGCPLCLIVDSCPGFPCPDGNFCFPSNQRLPNGRLLGMCYSNPCSAGQPLEDSMGFTIPCSIDTNDPTCPNSYTCTPSEINKGVCCPVPTITTSSTTPLCPEFYGCSDGITQYDEFGCPLCLIVDSCPGFRCPDEYYCFPSNERLPNGQLLGMCYSNPCGAGEPLQDIIGFSIPCDYNNNQNCSDGYICTSIDSEKAVCCPSIITTTIPTTLPCPTTECLGQLYYEPGNDCPICLHDDTCRAVSCPKDQYCLVSSINSPTCVFNPCSYNKPYENELGATIMCTSDESICPNGFICLGIPYDYENRSVCCPLDTTTPSPTTCPTITDCEDGIIENFSGCDVCIYPDSCPRFPCPDFLYCLSSQYYISEFKYILVGRCITNPCLEGKPLENNGTVLCDSQTPCFSNYACTTIESIANVCCPIEPSSSTMPPTELTNGTTT